MSRPRTPHFLRALRHRNFRLFFMGQSISLVGTWMQTIAMGWLVASLNGSAWQLGVVAFANRVPSFIFAPIGGVLAERFARQKFVILTQILLMLQGFVVTILVWFNWITFPEILLLSTFNGIVSAFDLPARQAFYVDMIEDRADLTNAIALNSSMVNAARLVGPATAGILIAWVGTRLCFLIDALSYIAVVWALSRMRDVPFRVLAHKGNVWTGLREGLGYAYRFAPVRMILILVAITSFFAMPYATFVPLVVSDRLNGNAVMFGYLMGVSGIGALAGALYLAVRHSARQLERDIALASSVLGLAVIALALAHTVAVAIVAIIFAGLGMIMTMAASNTMLQTIVDDRMRGRIMGCYTMAFIGVLPFGNLAEGWVAHRIGIPWTLSLGGVVCIAGSVHFASKLKTFEKLVAPIFEAKGTTITEETSEAAKAKLAELAEEGAG